jgi:hypothetical protein
MLVALLQEVYHLLAALRYQPKHGLYLTGCEGRTQAGSHIPPAFTWKPELRHYNTRNSAHLEHSYTALGEVNVILCLVERQLMKTVHSSSGTTWNWMLASRLVLVIYKEIDLLWRPIGLWGVEAPTFSRQSAHRWRWGCQPHMPADRPFPQEVSWYWFLLGAKWTPGPHWGWKDEAMTCNDIIWSLNQPPCLVPPYVMITRSLRRRGGCISGNDYRIIINQSMKWRHTHLYSERWKSLNRRLCTVHSERWSRSCASARQEGNGHETWHEVASCLHNANCIFSCRVSERIADDMRMLKELTLKPNGRTFNKKNTLTFFLPSISVPNTSAAR